MKEFLKKLKDYRVKDKEDQFAIDLLIKRISQTNDNIEICISKAADEFAQIMYSDHPDPDACWLVRRATVEFYNDILD